MKGFQRADRFFSLCGLNCGLCTMHISGNCPGCGGGEGNQTCKIARCSLEHGGVEYCFQCDEFPCEQYSSPATYDSFITKRNRLSDMEKMKQIGSEAYEKEQQEKVSILNELLEQYNDGRKKTLYSLAVNLLDLEVLQYVMSILRGYSEQNIDIKVKAAYATELLLEKANNAGVELKLRKKPKKS